MSNAFCAFFKNCCTVQFLTLTTVKSQFEPAGSIKIATFLVRVELIYFFNSHQKRIINQNYLLNSSKILIKIYSGKTWLNMHLFRCGFNWNIFPIAAGTIQKRVVFKSGFKMRFYGIIQARLGSARYFYQMLGSGSVFLELGRSLHFTYMCFT